ncbi:hypothetical protein IT575_05635 [bacterium]|nr:hypothetical protein [bacterium]
MSQADTGGPSGLLRYPWLSALLCVVPWLYIAWNFWSDTAGQAYVPGEEARRFALVYVLAGLCVAALAYLILLPRRGFGPRIGAVAGSCCAWPLAFFGAVFGFMLLMLLGVNGNEQQQLQAKWAYTWSVIASLAVPQIILILLGSMIGGAFVKRQAGGE